MSEALLQALTDVERALETMLGAWETFYRRYKQCRPGLLLPDLPAKHQVFLDTFAEFAEALAAARGCLPSAETGEPFRTLRQWVENASERVARWLEAFNKRDFWSPGQWDWSYDLPRSMADWSDERAFLTFRIEDYREWLRRRQREELARKLSESPSVSDPGESSPLAAGGDEKSPSSRRRKRQPGEPFTNAELKIIAGLVRHHRLADPESINNEPIKVRELAAASGVSPKAVSHFFRKHAGSYARYKYLCNDAEGLAVWLRHLDEGQSLRTCGEAIIFAKLGEDARGRLVRKRDKPRDSED